MAKSSRIVSIAFPSSTVLNLILHITVHLPPRWQLLCIESDDVAGVGGGAARQGEWGATRAEVGDLDVGGFLLQICL